MGGVQGGGSSRSVWKDETRVGGGEFGLCPGGEPSRLPQQGSDKARSVMEIDCFLPMLGAFSLCFCFIRYHCFKGLEQITFH